MSNQDIFSQRGAGLVPSVTGTLSSRELADSEREPDFEVAGGLQAVVGPVCCNTGPNGHDAGNFASNQGVDAGHIIPMAQSTMAVRRLLPVECERLQGFKDDHTLIPWKGKPASECPDGPRYKAMGNSMAVPVMRWIGTRLDALVKGTL